MPYIAGLYEAGGCLPSPSYDLRRWINVYQTTVARWPSWAPQLCTNCGNAGPHFVSPAWAAAGFFICNAKPTE